jgi:hypothetical protein
VRGESLLGTTLHWTSVGLSQVAGTGSRAPSSVPKRQNGPSEARPSQPSESASGHRDVRTACGKLRASGPKKAAS